MFMSESIINNLLMEVDSLSYRLKDIKKTYCNTDHDRLRERLVYEDHNILLRVKEIFYIAKEIDKKTKESISFSKLLLEKCRRTIAETKLERDLFFL